ncbi:HAD family hydrolase [Devriesea agamarum]|uniref:HAD family hydrolase n=1 Tax=Devriesea agamarum TaxID=472569 RepID=UPI00071D3909|nr:HAD family hydrolase [Devriesea agamarum]
MNGEHPVGLVALDIDGTIVGPNGVFEDVKDAVRNLQRHGWLVVVATGRSPVHALGPASVIAGRKGLGVCSNGAVTAWFETKPALVGESPMRVPGEPEAVVRSWEIEDLIEFNPREVLEIMLGAFPDALCGLEIRGEKYLLNAPFPDGHLPTPYHVAEYEQLLDASVTRVAVYSPNHTSQEFSEVATAHGLNCVGYDLGSSGWIDIALPGVSKATGLEALRRRYGIAPENTVAIGDGPNDLDMLDWAGTAVAPGNAGNDVKERADLVVGRFDEGGVAEFLRGL